MRVHTPYERVTYIPTDTYIEGEMRKAEGGRGGLGEC